MREKYNWIFSLFPTGVCDIQTEPKEVKALISSYSAASSIVSEGNY